MEHNRWRLYLKILAWLVALVYFALAVGRMLDLWISGAWFGGRAFQVCGVWLAMLGSVIFSLVFWYLEEILVTSDTGQNA